MLSRYSGGRPTSFLSGGVAMIGLKSCPSHTSNTRPYRSARASAAVESRRGAARPTLRPPLAEQAASRRVCTTPGSADSAAPSRPQTANSPPRASARPGLPRIVPRVFLPEAPHLPRRPPLKRALALLLIRPTSQLHPRISPANPSPLAERPARYECMPPAPRAAVPRTSRHRPAASSCAGLRRLASPFFCLT